MKSSEIRETFLSYFEQREHLRRPSGSLVPAPDDTSTLLTIAGMQPLKPYFQGREEPPSRRLATCQRCLSHPRHRGGRQHRPPPHLLRDARQLQLRRLLQAGGDRLRLGALGRGVRLRPGADLGDRVRGRRGARPRARHRVDRDLEGPRASPRSGSSRCRAPTTSGRPATSAPAGPTRRCTSTAARPSAAPTTAPATTPSASSSTGTTSSWPTSCTTTARSPSCRSENIDTGLGLERMAAIQQGVESVFETDLLRPLVELAEELSGRATATTTEATRAMRILADHSRGTVNLIADGVVPSNEDRGYVLRRIMRRAIQQGRVLGLEPPYLDALRRARDRDARRRLSPARRASARRSCAGSATRSRASGARSTAAPSCSPG